MVAERHRDKQVIVVAGPTASGKSALALAIAERFGGEIINADSMQVYREFRVLTARPSTAEEARTSHHLYGILTAMESCSAGFWLQMALDVIADLRRRRMVPVVCGGTGLYLKVLMEGIAPIPLVPPEIIDEARQLFEQHGGDVFRERLAELYPGAGAKLGAGDRQRLIRAYSVAKATGLSLADWQSEQPKGPPIGADFTCIVLKPQREALYRRIEERFDAMVAAGAVDEVAALLPSHLDPNLPAMKALGVPEFARYLRGECQLAEAVEKAKQATRNFAKRQFSWFRNQIAADLVFEGFGDTEAATSAAFRLLDPLWE